MKIKNIFLLSLLFFAGCKNNPQKTEEKFDKTKWAIKQGMVYPYRNNMLTSLLATDTLKGLHKAAVLSLLGPPNRTDTNYLFYTVAQKLFANTFPPSHKIAGN